MDSFDLKHKSDLHLARKLWHACGVCSMVVVYNICGPGWSWFVLGTVGAIMVPLDLMRKSNPTVNRMAVRVFGPVMRRHELDGLSGLTYLLAGALFLLLFFDRHILTTTLLFLAFGDPVASFFGLRFGKDKIVGNKTLQGTVAAFVTCTLIAAAYYYYHNIMTERLLIVAPLSGLIGALAEMIPVGKLDDNFTFPVICSVLLWTLFQLFGGFAL